MYTYVLLHVRLFVSESDEERHGARLRLYLYITHLNSAHKLRLERNGTFTPLATHFQGKRLNSPNDLVFGPGGDLYFTDPPYGLNGKEDDPLRCVDPRVLVCAWCV